jgi:pimeloyl-ACP methyl ester carboxylesterase
VRAENISAQEDRVTIATEEPAHVRNVVLVHGAFVDGSGWEGVHRILSDKGYRVTIVQNPTASLAEDASYVTNALAAQDGPVILVGHSYGGAVITEAGRHPNVEALVYIAAWVPDRGQSVLTLSGKLPANGAPSPVLPPHEGFILVDPERFAASFAADVEPDKAAFMAVAQVPWGVEAAGGCVAEPAWESRPSWYLVAADDRMIPPAAQRMMAANAGASITEAAGSHAIFISNPAAAAALIERAAERMTAAA